MGFSQSKEIKLGDLIILFILLVFGWIVITSFSYLFTRFLLDKLRTFWGVLGVVIVLSCLYLALSLATNTFLFYPV